LDKLIAMALPIVVNIGFAILILVIGLIAIKKILKLLQKGVEKSALDNTLKPFILSMVDISLKVLLAISIIKMLGIDTTSFVAAIAAAGFAVGLAFQGSLSNFAGGVLLLILRPFKAGDFIEVGGNSGVVQAVQILYTELITVDNKVIYIPNGNLSNAEIINYSVKDTRRVDLKFGVGYNEDTDIVITTLKEIVNNHSMVLGDPEPFVRMSEHGDSAVIFTVRVWCKQEDYWTVHFDIIETVKRRFDEENISIPYPQTDVHVYTG